MCAGLLGRVDVRPLEMLDGPLAAEDLSYSFRELSHTTASLKVVARSGTVRVIAGPQISNYRNFQKASPIIREVMYVEEAGSLAAPALSVMWL